MKNVTLAERIEDGNKITIKYSFGTIFISFSPFFSPFFFFAFLFFNPFKPKKFLFFASQKRRTATHIGKTYPKL